MTAVPYPPPPKKKKIKTEARERLRKPDTNRVPWRHTYLSKIMSLDNIFYKIARVSVKVLEIFYSSGKFAI